MRYTEITEARRNKSVNQKQSAMDALQKYAGQKDVFVSYTEDVGAMSHGYGILRSGEGVRSQGRKQNVSGHKIGINPMSHYDTPVAIYTYPVDYVIALGGNVDFQANAPYIQVVRVKPHADIWYLDRSDRFEWRQMYQEVYNEITERYGPNDIDFEDMYPDVEEGSPEYDAAYDNWLATKQFNPKTHPAVGKLAAAKLREMGYDGVADIDGHGIIHDNEPTQAFFLSKSAFTHIETIHNISPKTTTPSAASIYVKNLSKFVVDVERGKVSDDIIIQVVGSHVLSKDILRKIKLPKSIISLLKNPLAFEPAKRCAVWYGYLVYPTDIQIDIIESDFTNFEFIREPSPETCIRYIELCQEKDVRILWNNIPKDVAIEYSNKMIAENPSRISDLEWKSEYLSPRTVEAVMPRVLSDVHGVGRHWFKFMSTGMFLRNMDPKCVEVFAKMSKKLDRKFFINYANILHTYSDDYDVRKVYELVRPMLTKAELAFEK